MSIAGAKAGAASSTGTPARKRPAAAPGAAAAKPSRATRNSGPGRSRTAPVKAAGAAEEGAGVDPAPGSARARVPESEKLTINLGAVDLGSIDLLVAEGFFSNRSDLIRTAVRNLLAAHRDIVNGALVRQERTLGLRRVTRAELEALRQAGERIRIGVVGLVVIEPDVPADLIRGIVGTFIADPAMTAGGGDDGAQHAQQGCLARTR